MCGLIWESFFKNKRMNLSSGQEWRLRHREQTCGHSGGGEGGRAVSEHRRHCVENSQAVAGEDGSYTQDTQVTGEASRMEQHKYQALLLTRRRAETLGAGERLQGSGWETGQTEGHRAEAGRPAGSVLASPRQKPKAWTGSMGTGLT